jgi:DNA polymerase-3 subunit delta
LKLPLKQLSSHLDKGLAGTYLVAADEPLLVAEAADDIRQAARARGFEERELHVVDRGFRWDALTASADSLSLFSSRRIIEVRLSSPRPGDAGAKAIRALSENSDPDRLLLITVQAKLDAAAQRSVWAKTVERHGVVVEIWPVGRSELPRWITARARRRGISIARDAAELLADRVEGNLLAADQEIAKLALIHDGAEIDTGAVLGSVASSARFDVFRLSDAIVAGDLRRALSVLAGLESDGTHPTLIAWAVVREIDLLARLKSAAARGQSVDSLMGRLRVWRNRQPLLKRALARYSLDELEALLARAAEVDRAVKGAGREQPWEAVTGLVLALLAPERGRRSA